MTQTNTTNENQQLFPFLCFYKGKRLEVHAPTTYAAQLIAQQAFRTKKGWEISVSRADKEHIADF